MTTHEALLQRVLANPDDIAMRRVYADALCEAGDPRGELIQLQCAERPPGRAQKSRVNALLKEHLDEWLGPLAPVVLKKGLVFERGFLSRCVLKASIARHTKPGELREIKAAAGHPLWSTVTHLRSAPPWPDSPMQAIYLHPVMRSLRSVVANASSIPELCAGERERPIEVLHTRLPTPIGAPRFSNLKADFDHPEAAEALAHCSALPGLHTLIAWAYVPVIRAIAGPVMRRLRHLRLDGAEWDRFGNKAWDDIAPWPALFRELKLTIPSIELRCGSLGTENQGRADYRVVFRLDDQKQYTRLEVLIGPTSSQTKERLDDQIERFATMLGQIADGLTRLRVSLLKKPRFEPSFRPFEKLGSRCRTLDELELPRQA